LQTFEHGKFWPRDFNLLVGARSHFFHGFTDAKLRRSVRMTAAQKRRREKLKERHGRPEQAGAGRIRRRPRRMSKPCCGW
jgi:hypothetical protein